MLMNVESVWIQYGSQFCTSLQHLLEFAQAFGSLVYPPSVSPCGQLMLCLRESWYRKALGMLCLTTRDQGPAQAEDRSKNK
jgi:hypothetical protein